MKLPSPQALALTRAMDRFPWNEVHAHMAEKRWSWHHCGVPEEHHMRESVLYLAEKSALEGGSPATGGFTVGVSPSTVAIRFKGQGKKKPVVVPAPVWEVVEPVEEPATDEQSSCAERTQRSEQDP